jgi:hypothetical protein
MNNINKNTVRLLTVALFVLAVALPTFAASATLDLQGVVAQKLEIAVTPDAAASSLVLDADNSVDGVVVASVKETSNSRTGYTVTVSSLYTGNLQGQDDSSHKISYTISYDGTTYPVSSPATVVDTTGKTQRNGNPKAVKIFYDGTFSGEGPYADTYKDTLTFTIAAK